MSDFMFGAVITTIFVNTLATIWILDTLKDIFLKELRKGK